MSWRFHRFWAFRVAQHPFLQTQRGCEQLSDGNLLIPVPQKAKKPKRNLGWNPDVEANNLETLIRFGIFQTFLGEPMRTTPCQVAYKVVSSMCARCISVCAQLQRSTRKQARCNCSSSYNFISGARGQVVSWTG